MFQDAGAQAKISSIHVNGWFGDYDKLSMTRLLFREVFGEDLEAVREQVVFAVIRPTTRPCSVSSPIAVGVANVLDFADCLKASPAGSPGPGEGPGSRSWPGPCSEPGRPVQPFLPGKPEQRILVFLEIPRTGLLFSIC